MKPAIRPPGNAAIALLAVFLIWLALASGAFAIPPAWWASRGATDGQPPLDFAVANQGQLKHFTGKAIDELNDRIPGGAGEDLNNLLLGWIQEYQNGGYSAANPLPADFAAMNSGQLKWIAAKIHNRLVFARYEDSLPPWLVPNPATDSQLVNLGQLKSVFDFDLSAPAGQIAQWWEKFYFNTIGIQPDGDDDGDGRTNIEEWLAGTNPANPDTDGDSVLDGDDAAPSDGVINWRRTAEPHFAVVELPIGGVAQLGLLDLTPGGMVLLANGEWERILIGPDFPAHTLTSANPPTDMFGSVHSVMVGEKVLGIKMNSQGEVTSYLWDPLDSSYTPYSFSRYYDRIRDSREDFLVQSAIYDPLPGDYQYSLRLGTKENPLPGSAERPDYWSDARIETNGNIVSDSK